MDGGGPSCRGCWLHIPEVSLPLCGGVVALWEGALRYTQGRVRGELPQAAVLSEGGVGGRHLVKLGATLGCSLGGGKCF